MVDISRILIYALQGTSGAIAGYITNTYAVNMLFKEYTPFKIGQKVILPYKFGGVIKNRKQQFVDEISSLVERDIINGKTLKDTLATEGVQREITNIFNSFLNEALIEGFNDKSLNELAGFNKTIENIKDFTNENSIEILNILLNKSVESINLQQLVSKEQIKHISDNLYKLLYDGMDNNSEIINAIDDLYDLYDESSHIKVSALIDDEAITTIKSNINYIVTDIIENYFKDDNNITNLVDEIMNLTEVSDLIDKLQINLKEKSLEDFISDEEFKALSNDISKYISDYLKSEEGINLAQNVIKEFIKIIRDIEFSIYDIMPAEIGEKLTAFINTKLPVFLPYISEWILKNRDEFDIIIEESINEGTENMDGNIKRVILSVVKNSFLDNIETKNEVIEKVIAFIESYKLDDAEGDKLSEAIVKYLKNTKIKDIIIALENNNILNDTIVNKCSEFIINKLSNNSNNLITKLLVMQKSKKLGDFIKLDFKEIFNEKALGHINNIAIKKKDELKVVICESILNKINIEVNKIINEPIKDIIPKDTINNLKDNSNKTIKHLLMDNEIIFKKTLKEEIESVINNFNLSKAIEDNNENIMIILKDKLLTFEEEVFNESKNIKVTKILKTFSKDDKRIVSISNEAIIYLQNNLEDLLKGKIKTIVYDNLIVLDEDEICDLAQKFMGTELQPLSIFGGFLGLIGGLIFGAFSTNIGLLGSYNNIYQLLGSVLLMGLIGVATNVIAIAMLFRPYKKNKFLSKIQFLKNFALGYIPAHKGDLANGIGAVIDNEILNGVKIQKLFKSKKETINTSLIKLINNSNYKVLHDNLVKNKESVCNYLYKRLISTIKINDEKISNKLSHEICNVKVDNVFNKGIFNKLTEKIKSKRDSLSRYLLKYLEKNISSNEKLINVLPPEVVNNINNNVEVALKDIIKNKPKELLNEAVLKNIILNSNVYYNNLINKELQSIIDEETVLSLKKQSVNKMESFIYVDLRYILSCIVKEVLTVELDNDKTIETMFNGNIKNILHNNLNNISNNLVLKLTDIIGEKESYIGDIVKSNVNSRLNFLQKMGYAMAGGDRIVDNCVNIAVNKKVPLFISSKINEVESIVENSLNKIVYPMKLSDLNINVNEINSSEFIYNIFESLSYDKKLNDIINIINDEIMHKALTANINDILTPLNLNTTEKLYDKFKYNIEFARVELLNNIDKNSEALVNYSKNLINNNLKDIISNTELKDVFNNINEDNIKYTAERIVDTALNSEAVNSGIINIFEEIYDVSFENKKLSHMLNDDLLRRDMKVVIVTALESAKIQEGLLLAIQDIFMKISKDDFEIIDINLKDDVNKIVSEAIVNVLIMHTKSILESLELKAITYAEIEKMNPKEINDLFDSFAGTYFKKLYSYGMVGAIFGINLYLPIVWALAFYIKGKVNKK